MSLRSLCIALLLCIHFFLFYKANLHQYLLGGVPLWDFDVYYQTAQDVLAGANPYQLAYMQTAGPPLVIVPFFIFTLVDLTTARIVFSLISVGSVALTAWLLAKNIFTRDPVIYALCLNALLLILFQTRFNFLLGQPNLLLMAAITYLLTKQKTKLFALLVSLLITFKTHYVLILLALLKKPLRNLTFVSLILLATMLLTLPLVGSHNYTYYLQNRLEKHIGEPLLIQDVGYYNQSLRATLARLGIAEVYLGATLVFFLVGGFYTYSHKDLSLGILLSLLISPVVWQHYMVLTYPIVYITLLAYARKKNLPWHSICASMLLFSHLPWLHEKSVSFTSGMLASHYFFGVVVLFYSRVRLHQKYVTVPEKF
jgi:hypothetical protein